MQLEGNPLSTASLPSSIQGDTRQLLEFMQSNLKVTRSSQVHAKVVFVGKGNSGKTTLLRSLQLVDTHGKIRKRHYKELMSGNIATDGVELSHWRVRSVPGQAVQGDKGGANASAPLNTVEKGVADRGASYTAEQVHVHAYDFAGQSLYYSTHQYFMSPSSVYILVISLEEPVDHTYVDFWMEAIKNTGGKSVVFIVATKIDLYSGSVDDLKVEMHSLMERLMRCYSNVVRLDVVNSVKGEGVKTMLDRLVHYICDSNWCKWTIPATTQCLITRLNIYRAVHNRPTILWDDFEAAAASCGVRDTDLAHAVKFMCTTGVFLQMGSVFTAAHRSYRSLMVLDIPWLTRLLCSVVTLQHRFVQNGLIRLSHMRHLLRSLLSDDLESLVLEHLELFDVAYGLPDDENCARLVSLLWRRQQLYDMPTPAAPSSESLEKASTSSSGASTSTVDGEDPADHDRYVLIPYLLPDISPTSDILEKWFRTDGEDGVDDGRVFTRVYEFSFLPPGFFHRLVVRLLASDVWRPTFLSRTDVILAAQPFNDGKVVRPRSGFSDLTKQDSFLNSILFCSMTHSQMQAWVAKGLQDESSNSDHSSSHAESGGREEFSASASASGRDSAGNTYESTFVAEIYLSFRRNRLVLRVTGPGGLYTLLYCTQELEALIESSHCAQPRVMIPCPSCLIPSPDGFEERASAARVQETDKEAAESLLTQQFSVNPLSQSMPAFKEVSSPVNSANSEAAEILLMKRSKRVHQVARPPMAGTLSALEFARGKQSETLQWLDSWDESPDSSSTAVSPPQERLQGFPKGHPNRTLSPSSHPQSDRPPSPLASPRSVYGKRTLSPGPTPRGQTGAVEVSGGFQRLSPSERARSPTVSSPRIGRPSSPNRPPKFANTRRTQSFQSPARKRGKESDEGASGEEGEEAETQVRKPRRDGSKVGALVRQWSGKMEKRISVTVEELSGVIETAYHGRSSTSFSDADSSSEDEEVAEDFKEPDEVMYDDMLLEEGGKELGRVSPRPPSPLLSPRLRGLRICSRPGDKLTDKFDAAQMEYLTAYFFDVCMTPSSEDMIAIHKTFCEHGEEGQTTTLGMIIDWFATAKADFDSRVDVGATMVWTKTRKSKDGRRSRTVERRSKKVKAQAFNEPLESGKHLSSLPVDKMFEFNSCLDLCRKRHPFVRCKGCALIRLDRIVPDVLATTTSNLPSFRIDDVRDMEKIGVGGYATVFRGTFRDKLVAVKKLHTEVCGSGSAAFAEYRKEVWILSMVDHPCVLSLLRVCNEPLAIMMEYMELGNLHDYITTTGNVTLATKLRLLSHVAFGMRYLHIQQPCILHLDLKSLNVLITSSCEEPSSECKLATPSAVDAKIADFGKSHYLALGNSLREAVVKVENCLWTAPEILASNEMSKAADVYSYGIVLWEVMEEALPFSDCRWMNRLEVDIINGRRPALAALMGECWSGIPEQRPDFSTIILKLEEICIESLKVRLRELVGHGAGTRRPKSSAFSERSEKDFDQ